MNATPQSIRNHAYLETFKALRLGQITKPKACQKCGRGGRLVVIYAHHVDYNKPLEIDWLCGSCHKLAHIAAGDVNDRWTGEVLRPKIREPQKNDKPRRSHG